MEEENFRQIVRKRLLDDILKTASQSSEGDWSILVVDKFTLKVFSSACTMSEMIDCGVSLIEEIEKGREPMPSTAGIYFIEPEPASVARLIKDFSNEKLPQYASAHVFFSSRVPNSVLTTIKSAPGLLKCLKTLKEANMAVLAEESTTFTTGNPNALQVLFKSQADQEAQYESELETISTRLATVFGALREMPVIRYQGAKEQGKESTSARSRVSQRVAQAVHERVSYLQRTNPDMPQSQTCDLLVLDRSLDPVAPVIHEWTYEAMCYDLLPLEGDMYQRKVTTTGGEEKVKQEKLGESDSLWREYRYLHVAEAFIRVAENAKNFASTNKTARSMVQKSGQAASADMSTTRIKNLVESLPEYQNQLAGIARHTEIASTLQDLVTARSLNDVGKLEQDIVFGDANSKDLIKLLEAKPALEDMDKLRVLLCYMALNPEKLDAGEIKKWEKLMRIPSELMSAVANLEHLRGVATKKSTAMKVLSFGRKASSKSGQGGYRANEEENWELSRFQPLIQTLLHQLTEGQLPEEDFPHVKLPVLAGGEEGKDATKGKAARASTSASVRSSKSVRAKPAKGEEEERTGLLLGDLSLRGKRLVVFVIGGMTKSEVRAAHEVSKAAGREVIIGSTSQNTPLQFVEHMTTLG